jgi:thioredoxin 1
MQVSYHDCFDKESLVQRLIEARQQQQQQQQKQEGRRTNVYEPAQKAAATTAVAATTTTTPAIDMESKVAELRSKSLKELKLECSKRGMRYATFREKDDFVRAIVQDVQSSLEFSATGLLRPGMVTDVTGEQLDVEMSSSQHSTTPILVDVYATWCGPCKMVVPQLEAAAKKFGSNVRVVKIDSDKHSSWASRYQVQGLPTMLLIKEGRVVDRLEGAHMTDVIVNLVEKHS